MPLQRSWQPAKSSNTGQNKQTSALSYFSPVSLLLRHVKALLQDQNSTAFYRTRGMHPSTRGQMEQPFEIGSHYQIFRNLELWYYSRKHRASKGSLNRAITTRLFKTSSSLFLSLTYPCADVRVRFHAGATRCCHGHNRRQRWSPPPEPLRHRYSNARNRRKWSRRQRSHRHGPGHCNWRYWCHGERCHSCLINCKGIRKDNQRNTKNSPYATVENIRTKSPHESTVATTIQAKENSCSNCRYSLLWSRALRNNNNNNKKNSPCRRSLVQSLEPDAAGAARFLLRCLSTVCVDGHIR